MNRVALGIITLMFCSSCVVYRYDVLNSNISSAAEGPFTFENDTMRLSYSFPNGMATLQIFNKSVDPLYVDWSRSARIADGVSTSYDVAESPVSFIPPGSGLTRPLFSVLDYSPVETNKPIEYRYTRESSPLNFRSFLMLSFDHDFYEPFTMDHTFWLARRRQTREPFQAIQKENAYSSKVMTDEGADAATVLGVICAIPIAWVLYQLNYTEDY